MPDAAAMPLPTPSGDESESAFIGRCMSALAEEFEDEEQRLAVCYSQWRGERAMSAPRLVDLATFTQWAAAKQVLPTEDVQNLVLCAALPTKVASVTGRVKRFTISTAEPDRMKDSINQHGWDLEPYKQAPRVLWAHDYAFPPIGRALTIELVGAALISDAEFMTAELHPFADMIFRMVDGGWLNTASVGFRPLKWVYNEERKGIDFSQQELLEYSVVPVPANPKALLQAKSAGIDLAPLRGWAEQILADTAASQVSRVIGKSALEQVVRDTGPLRTISIPRADVTALRATDRRRVPAGSDAVPDPARWNKALPMTFDVANQELEPALVEYAWAAQYLGVAVKDLHVGCTSVPCARMGSFLTAIDEYLAVCTTEDVRKIVVSPHETGSTKGREAPPVYSHIQLNSTRSRDFLTDGTRFLRTPFDKMVLKVAPVWFGIDITVYVGRKFADAGVDFIETRWARAKALNFLKGEAFSVSGEFLTKTGESWDDLFLTEHNAAALKRCVELLNTEGKDLTPRGVLLVGPPGTGKTMAGRVMMNQTKDVTFVWLAARDFYYSGAFGGFTYAFDIARECAPSLVFIEDVDNWLSPHTVDLLKTEMDGIARHTGVVTVLTSNHPESLPAALIDRPGRFHDVLKVGLPSPAERRMMVLTWIPDLADATFADILTAVVEGTEGYSGAHVKELATFSSILRTQESLELPEAVRRALDKIQEQRELITETQQGRYQMSRDVAAMVLKAVTTNRVVGAPTSAITGGSPPIAMPEAFADLPDAAALGGGQILRADIPQSKLARTAIADRFAETKKGRVLSAANEKELRSAVELLGTVVDRVRVVLAKVESAVVEDTDMADKAAKVPKKPMTVDHDVADCPDPEKCPRHRPEKAPTKADTLVYDLDDDEDYELDGEPDDEPDELDDDAMDPEDAAQLRAIMEEELQLAIAEIRRTLEPWARSEGTA